MFWQITSPRREVDTSGKSAKRISNWGVFLYNLKFGSGVGFIPQNPSIEYQIRDVFPNTSAMINLYDGPFYAYFSRVLSRNCLPEGRSSLIGSVGSIKDYITNYGPSVISPLMIRNRKLLLPQTYPRMQILYPPIYEKEKSVSSFFPVTDLRRFHGAREYSLQIGLTTFSGDFGKFTDCPEVLWGGGSVEKFFGAPSAPSCYLLTPLSELQQSNGISESA